MIRRLIVLFGILASLQSYAQPHPDSLIYTTIKWEYIENTFLSIDINGVPLWSVLDKEQIIEKFGIPDKYSNKESELGIDRGYRYGRTFIYTRDNEFNGFDIRDNRFKVLTSYFDGGIGVGDHISVFKGFKEGMLHQRNPKQFGEFCYMIADASDGYFCIYTDPDGYITLITYSFPV
ncbi:MAG: hypothetical protein IKY66_11460 [Bacteroidales bacterium]|nr:hypothetical protein [Bacteroidales bacterium]